MKIKIQINYHKYSLIFSYESILLDVFLSFFFFFKKSFKNKPKIEINNKIPKLKTIF